MIERRPTSQAKQHNQLPNYSIMDAPTFYSRLTRDVNQAQSQVDLHFYIVQKDKKTQPFFTALENAARRGVNVRFVIDRVTATTIVPTYHDFVTRKEIKRLNRLHKKEGLPIEVKSARQKHDSINPLRRSHKKFAVIDAHSENAHAYVGGTNIAGFFFPWRDSMTYVTRDIANTLEKDFEKTWAKTNTSPARYVTGDPQDKTEILVDSKISTHNMERFLEEISQAKHTIWIETTYLKGRQLSHALREVKRKNPDIDIKLLVPYPPISNDPSYRFFSQFWLNPLVKAGAEVYLYGRQERRFTHAKTALIDDTAIIGSSNFVNGVVVGGNAEMLMISKNPYFHSQAREWIKGGIDQAERYVPKVRS